MANEKQDWYYDFVDEKGSWTGFNSEYASSKKEAIKMATERWTEQGCPHLIKKMTNFRTIGRAEKVMLMGYFD
jgi:hypothetical protein